MNIDHWQLVASVAAIALTMGFVDQLRVTFKSRSAEGLSLIQWVVFAIASAVFSAYYVHLHQWLMVIISIFGTCCCLLLSAMILRWNGESDARKNRCNI